MNKKNLGLFECSSKKKQGADKFLGIYFSAENVKEDLPDFLPAEPNIIICW